MGVAPEAIRGCLQPVIDSNISFAQILFLEFIESFFSLYIFHFVPFFFDGIFEARDLVGPLFQNKIRFNGPQGYKDNGLY
jgi:hypothetical protein